jgi:ankyrin repeat protein
VATRTIGNVQGGNDWECPGDVQGGNGQTAAMLAAWIGGWRSLAWLIDAGADVTVSRDRRGWTALHHAAVRGRVGSPDQG